MIWTPRGGTSGHWWEDFTVGILWSGSSYGTPPQPKCSNHPMVTRTYPCPLNLSIGSTPKPPPPTKLPPQTIPERYTDGIDWGTIMPDLSSCWGIPWSQGTWTAVTSSASYSYCAPLPWTSSVLRRGGSSGHTYIGGGVTVVSIRERVPTYTPPCKMYLGCSRPGCPYGRGLIQLRHEHVDM